MIFINIIDVDFIGIIMNKNFIVNGCGFCVEHSEVAWSGAQIIFVFLRYM